MTKKDNNNRSLILYTSLIFIVAIVMIIVSFLAQTHLDQSMVIVQDEEKVSLSNKAAQISEENMQLVELNKGLKEQNVALSAKNSDLNAQLLKTTEEAANYETLAEVYNLLCCGDKSNAQTLLEGISQSSLTEKQTELYGSLLEKAQ